MLKLSSLSLVIVAACLNIGCAAENRVASGITNAGYRGNVTVTENLGTSVSGCAGTAYRTRVDNNGERPVYVTACCPVGGVCQPIM